MLAIQRKRSLPLIQVVIVLVAVCLLLGGLYLLSLVFAPALAPFAIKPIDAKTLPAPKVGDNRIIIPKIGVDIAYGTDGEKSLDNGAWWRFPDRGNPVDGGNFIIAAHRFTLHNTIGETIEKSPFYNLGKLVNDDQVLIDYNGKRYLYQIDKIFSVKPTQVEIEAPSQTPKLTLYTCSLGGSSDGRLVLNAKLVGEVETVK